MNETESGAPLGARIERELEARAGVNAIVEVRGEEIVLSGLVDTPEASQAAADIVAELAPSMRLTNDLEVEGTSPVEVSDFYVGEGTTADTPESLEEIAEREGEIDPDFTDQRLSTSGLATAGVDPSEEEDNVYFPPTDPVITTDVRGEAQVLGGFSATSQDDVSVEPSASDDRLGDEAIADAVRRELREDAATTDLRIEVEVIEGVVYLRGAVEDVIDGENAEEVASRVPGVTDVVEELRVANV